MSVIDLILLGIVIEVPASAYEIQKDVEAHHLSRWARVSTPSIYKKVIQLREKGYLNSEVIREGNMPEKTVYSITESGRTYFEQLMAHYAAQPVVPVFDFNVVIANLSRLSPRRGRELVAEIAAGIDRSAAALAQLSELYGDMPYRGRAIIEQQQQVLQALSDWVRDFAPRWEACEAPEGQTGGGVQ